MNRPDWMIADLACQSFGLSTCALYDTLGPDLVEYVVNHSGLPMIACSVDKVQNVLQVFPNCPKLKVIISMDSLENSNVLKQWAQQLGVLLLDFSDIYALGRKNQFEYVKCLPSDTASLCYTSGTTGNYHSY